ncbi:ABC transporter ATP-binding protein [cyanobiont of Ornithocercus magnificus]|nr:ABC transporter ATP-binding protein [cyanobiont of Ornithocercus magnificus]
MTERHEKRLCSISLPSVTLTRILQIFSYLPPSHFRGCWFLLAISSAVGLSDLVFVGLVAKLVGSLSKSKLSDNLPFVQVFSNDALDRNLWIAAILIILIWISASLRFLSRLIEANISAKIWCTLGNKTYSNLLCQSFDYFNNSNSAALLTRLNRVLSKVSDGVILPLLTICSKSLSALILVSGVITTFGWIALAVFFLLVAAYSVASLLITPHMRFLVRQQFLYKRQVNEIFLDSTRSIRDIHLHASEKFFLNRFKHIGMAGKRYDRMVKILPDLPRFVIEPAGVTVLFTLGLLPPLLSSTGKSEVRDALPALVGIVFASLRLATPTQAVFRALNRLRASLPDLDDALELLSLSPKRLLDLSQSALSPEGIMPQYTIKLEGVSYQYFADQDCALQNVSLTIPVGARIALVGATGGGKTTAAHLLLGLLRPKSGQLLLDGVPLHNKEIQAWQQCCAFVPQNIMLLDTSIRANVAFGISDDAINEDALWSCLEMAQLADFVSELPYGAFTRVGENGMHLSGGQRQRLALARAFYKRARVLVLDEATSALDNKTESNVMESLGLIGRYYTTVIIAHRLSTIRYCDCIYQFSQGRTIASGTFDELQCQSDSFRELVKLQHG